VPGTPTPILGLIVPTVGGDANLWGTELNTNLQTIDLVGATAIFSVSSNYTATISKSPLTLIKVTTSGLTINITMPDPATNTGKQYNIKKMDAGAGIVNVIATIDLQTSWQLTNQFQCLGITSNGVTYDVVSVA
jgi:hypothetical protein